jgi:hypothetical protein
MVGPYVGLVGREAVVLMLAAPFTLALWIQTESLTMPAVILTLFMGLLLGGAPAEATMLGYLLVVAATVVAYRSLTGVGGR